MSYITDDTEKEPNNINDPISEQEHRKHFFSLFCWGLCFLTQAAAFYFAKQTYYISLLLLLPAVLVCPLITRRVDPRIPAIKQVLFVGVIYLIVLSSGSLFYTLVHNNAQLDYEAIAREYAESIKQSSQSSELTEGLISSSQIMSSTQNSSDYSSQATSSPSTQNSSNQSSHITPSALNGSNLSSRTITLAVSSAQTNSNTTTNSSSSSSTPLNSTTENSTPAPESNSSSQSSASIYATPTGDRYHYKASCAKKNAVEITWEVVMQRGLTPCGTCAKRDLSSQP